MTEVPIGSGLEWWKSLTPLQKEAVIEPHLDAGKSNSEIAEILGLGIERGARNYIVTPRNRLRKKREAAGIAVSWNNKAGGGRPWSRRPKPQAVAPDSKKDGSAIGKIPRAKPPKSPEPPLFLTEKQRRERGIIREMFGQDLSAFPTPSGELTRAEILALERMYES